MVTGRASEDPSPARVARAVVPMLAGVMSLCGCTSGVSLTIDVAPAACGGALAEASVRWVWGISEGECGVRPGPMVHAGGLDDLEDLTLPAGRFCFWALAVADECRVVAGVSTSRRLPSQDGLVVLRFDEDSCVSASEEPGWDGAVEAFAGCSPSCSPHRCPCSRAESCAVAAGTDGADGGVGLTASEAICPAPLSADLLAVGPTHACAASRGADDLWCWGLGPETVGPTRSPLPTLDGFDLRLARLAVGPRRTCVAMETASPESGGITETSWIWCRDDAGPWAPLGRPASRCEASIGRIDVRNLVVGGTEGSPFVCAISSNANGTGLLCWGADNPLRTDTEHPRAAELIDCAQGDGDGPLVMEVGRTARRLAAGYRQACLVGEGGFLDCWGVRLADVGCGSDEPIDDVAVSGDTTCVLDAGRRFCCDDGRFELGGVLEASVFEEPGVGAYGCLRFAGTVPFCAALDSATDAVVPLDALNAFVGRGLACGIGAGGVVRCIALTESAGALGTRFASPGLDLVCPPAP